MIYKVPDPMVSRAVLLRHDLQDGTFHFDLMLQRPGGPDSALVTFRVPSAIDSPGIQEFKGERIADHRPEYLDYEGAISGGRGQVRPVASGTCFICLDDDRRFVAVVDFGYGRRLLDADRGPKAWQFHVRLAGPGPTV